MWTLKITGEYFWDFRLRLGGCVCECLCTSAEIFYLCELNLWVHLCGGERVFRRPGSGLQCVELHGRISGEVLVCTLGGLDARWLWNWSMWWRGSRQTWRQILLSLIVHSVSVFGANLSNQWTWTDGTGNAEHEKKRGRKDGEQCFPVISSISVKHLSVQTYVRLSLTEVGST